MKRRHQARLGIDVPWDGPIRGLLRRMDEPERWLEVGEGARKYYPHHLGLAKGLRDRCAVEPSEGPVDRWRCEGTGLPRSYDPFPP